MPWTPTLPLKGHLESPYQINLGRQYIYIPLLSNFDVGLNVSDLTLILLEDDVCGMVIIPIKKRGY